MLCGGHVPSNGMEKDDWEKNFAEVPPLFTSSEKEDWLRQFKDVALSSDAFFPFVDNVLRASRSGVKYIAAPMGSQMDAAVAEACQRLGIVCKSDEFYIPHV